MKKKAKQKPAHRTILTKTAIQAMNNMAYEYQDYYFKKFRILKSKGKIPQP